MKKVSELLYKKYFISDKNTHLIRNQKSIKEYKKLEGIDKVFIINIDSSTKKRLYITQKGLFYYTKNSSFSMGWREFKSISIGYSRNSIFLGSLVLYLDKVKIFYSFFKEIQVYLSRTSIKNEEEAFKFLEENRRKLEEIEDKLDFYISLVEGFNKIKTTIYFQ